MYFMLLFITCYVDLQKKILEAKKIQVLSFHSLSYKAFLSRYDNDILIDHLLSVKSINKHIFENNSITTDLLRM